jgi:hypothetical protein
MEMKTFSVFSSILSFLRDEIRDKEFQTDHRTKEIKKTAASYQHIQSEKYLKN